MLLDYANESVCRYLYIVNTDRPHDIVSDLMMIAKLLQEI